MVRRLEAEETGADDHGRAAPPAADVLLDLDGVVDRPEHEAAVDAEALDRRDERARAGGDDDPVVRDPHAVREAHLARARSIAAAASRGGSRCAATPPSRAG